MPLQREVRRRKQRSGAVVERGCGTECAEWGREKRAEVGAVDCASVSGESEVWSVQDCQDVLCFGGVGAVAGEDC